MTDKTRTRLVLLLLTLLLAAPVASAQQPRDAAGFFARAVERQRAGSLNEAVEDYRQALKLKPDLLAAHVNLALAYVQLKRTDDAESYKRAAALKPHHFIYYSLSEVYTRLGRHEEAVAALKESVRLKPEFFEGHYELGTVYVKLGRHAEALEAFREAARVKPRDVDSNFRLGVEYLLTGDRVGARQQFYILKDLAPGAAEAFRRYIEK